MKRALLALLAVLAGAGLVFLGFLFALGDALCEEDEPGSCDGDPDVLVAILVLGGLALVLAGIGVGVRAAWRRIRGRSRAA